ncbi:bifunctional UDP-sugar hydrolase/5'-nucleotidase [Bacillus manliponensis]|uniref:bifunctional metallophosphatase/5'-nucleotidase n=1 Tax=Bacillus manliponensis TaxID=574376 RepID=UPI0035121404
MKSTEKNVAINILVTTDVHGTVYPIQYGNNEVTEHGLAKISTLIHEERKKNKYIIVIDNGDFIQGTPLTYCHAKQMNEKKNPMMMAANHIGYDAAVIGNHEFNYGMSHLNRAVAEANMPYLAANILHKDTMTPYFGKPYLIKRIESNVKVAILGVTTHYIPNWEEPDHIQNVVFEDALEATKNWVSHIQQEEQPDVMIVAYHGGFERDLRTGEPTENLTGENQGFSICKEVEGIDVLITGHQHRFISHTKVNGVTVLQGGYNGESLGKIKISLKEKANKWSIDSCNSELLYTKGVQPDKQMLTLLQPYETKTQKWLERPIGMVTGNMKIDDVMQARIQKHPFTEFINKVQMDIADVTISCTSLFHNKVTGFPNKITMRDIISNYIYPNTLKVLRVTGQDIKDALEKSAEYFTLNIQKNIVVNPAFIDPKSQHYNYDMWDGISYILNISKPIGERVVSLQYKGEPLSLTEEFDVVMNNYRASGGGDYHMYKGKPVIKEISIDMTEIITNYLLKYGQIEATLTLNWKVQK